jgi:hypothetical protein
MAFTNTEILPANSKAPWQADEVRAYVVFGGLNLKLKECKCVQTRGFVTSLTLFVRSFVRSFVCSFVRSFVCLFVCLFIYLFLCLMGE